MRGAVGLAGDRAAGVVLPTPVPQGQRLPGPGDGAGARVPEAIGKGRFSNAFIAMLLTERYAAERSLNSLVAGPTRQGAEISPATCAVGRGVSEMTSSKSS